MKKCPVVHFEMPAKDRERVKKFYSEVFGWEMDEMGDDLGHYIMASTTDTKDGRPTTPGTINGGFWESKEDQPPHVVISVDDVDKHMEIVKNAGGEIIDGPMDIPGIGKFVMIRDTEGNKVALLQPAPREKAE